MITKENFIKRMKLIQNFNSQQETLSEIIERISDGYCVVNIGDYLVTEIINMINESLNIKDEELLVWWLYESESIPRILYMQDKEISVKTLEELYDYLRDSYENNS